MLLLTRPSAFIVADWQLSYQQHFLKPDTNTSKEQVLQTGWIKVNSRWMCDVMGVIQKYKHATLKMHWHHSQSVWQAPDPSLGQKRVSAFFLPTWSCWGSGSSARQVYLNLCSCLDPSWLTLNGIQGVQGVLRRTSGQASRLQALNSCKT